MPIRMRSKGYGSGAGDGGERVPMLEREVGKLRREIEALKSQAGGAASGGLASWMTTALAAFGVLLGLMALLRH